MKGSSKWVPARSVRAAAEDRRATGEHDPTDAAENNYAVPYRGRDEGVLRPLLGLGQCVLRTAPVTHLGEAVDPAGVDDGRDAQGPEEEQGHDGHAHVVLGRALLLVPRLHC